MVLKLYANPHSTCSQRVALVLKEKEVPYEFVEVSFEKGEHKSSEYMKNNPFGQLPYIDDDGFILFESRAICQYIATKYADQGRKLIPQDLKENAIYLQGCSIEVTSFDSFASPMIYERLFKSYQGLTTDEHVAQRLEELLTSRLGVYETILSQQKYIGGNEITLADLYHVPVLALLPAVKYKGLDDKPAVSKWVAEISALPKWQEIVKNGLKP